nr:RluA family pseudouridine synthase [Solimicrobium silvestre]
MIATIPSNLHGSEIHPDELTGDLADEFAEESEASYAFNATPIIFKLDEDVCGDRLDKVIARLIPQFSRSRLQQWIVSGHVTVDGVAGRGKMTVLGGEEVIVYPQPAPEDNAYSPENMALDIVFEDKSMLVINKPAGLVVHPAAGNWSGTLLNGLLHHFPAISGVPRAGIVHRLDKDTSGLMVVAKTLEAQTDLVRQLQARTVKREYLALVWGRPNLSGTIDSPMARHPRDRIKMAVSDSPSAKPAVTHFQRIAIGVLDGKPVSLVECQLETGRTHQIRVHMAHLGFPLVGDVLYGKQHLASYFNRQALQARRLGLLHPKNQKECSWQVGLADDIAALLVSAGIEYAA